MDIRIKKIFIRGSGAFLILFFLSFGFLANAQTYYDSGYFQSKNLLQEQGKSIINKFGYSSLIPEGTTIKIRFSKDNEIWYNSLGIENGWDTLLNGGYLGYENAINIQALEWESDKFYYEVFLETEDNVKSPFLLETKLYYRQYSLSGEYTSQSKDFGLKVNFTTIEWDAIIEEGITSVKFQIATNNNNETWEFIGPDGTDSSYYLSSDENIWEGHDGSRYLKWRAYLQTEDPVKTPEIKDVSINYSSYLKSSSLISSPYNTFDSSNIVAGILWEEDVSEDNSISFQIRTSPDNIVWTDWMGPDGTEESYFEKTNEHCSKDEKNVSCFIPEQIEIGDGEDDQWFQYKVFLETSDGRTTPVLESISIIYVVNAPPEFEENPIAIHISDNNNPKWGNVLVSYSIRDPDTLEGTNTPEYITPSFYYSLDNGSSWQEINMENIIWMDSPPGGEIIDITGDGKKENKVKTEDWLTYTFYWDVKSQIPGTYSEESLIKVIINDNEAANNITTSNSFTFPIDTISPEITDPIIDASKEPANINFSCLDESSIEMAISFTSNFSGVEWVPYNPTFSSSLPGDPSTLYIKCRDIYGNVSEIASVTTPMTPSNIFWQDVSDNESEDWRIFIAWGIVDTPQQGFKRYKIYRREDDGEFNLLQEINDKNFNYIMDSGLSNQIEYSYKIKTEDESGNFSFFSNLITHTPSGVGGTDIAAPSISNVEAENIMPSSVSIRWETNKLSDSVVYFKASEEWPGEDKENYDLSQGVPSMVKDHNVILSGLSPDTQYFFMVESNDISGNTGKRTQESYTFTTASGPVISNVSITSVYDQEATITWNTNVKSSSYVVFSESPTLSEPIIITGLAMAVKSHTVRLTELKRGTTYYFYVMSEDENKDVSKDENIVNGSKQYYSFTTTLDTEPPVISNVEESLISHNGATLTWETNESATSKIRWGKDKNLNNETAETNFYTLKHSISITGLSSKTKYYYEVISTDRAGNIKIDDNEGEKYYFTTLDPETRSTIIQPPLRETTPPVLSNLRVINITQNSAVVLWESNKESDSFLSYGRSPSEMKKLAGETGERTNHNVSLLNLSQGTTYHIKAFGKDKYGNLGESNYISFKTLLEDEEPIEVIPEIPTEDLSEDEKEAIRITERGSRAFIEEILRVIPKNPHIPDIPEDLFLASISEVAPRIVSSPSISGPDIRVETGASSAIIEWITDKNANSLVAFAREEDFNPLSEEPYSIIVGNPEIKGTNHKVEIRGLEPSTRYYYQIRSNSLMGSPTISENRTFTTTSLFLEILDINFREVTGVSASLIFRTNTPARTEISLIDIDNQKEKIIEEKSFLRNHSINLEPLDPRTSYSVQIRAFNEEGEIASSPFLQFSTGVDNNPPEIMRVMTDTALSPRGEKIQTIITWRTDKLSTSQVFYSEGAISGQEMNFTTKDTNLKREHIVVIPSFKPGTVYRFYVQSEDLAGNINRSRDYTILTPQRRETIVEIIFKNFEQTFGWMRMLQF